MKIHMTQIIKFVKNKKFIENLIVDILMVILKSCEFLST